MGKGFLRSWLSIIATISRLATLAPGAVAQHKERRTRLRWLALLSGLLLATTTVNTVSAAGDDTPDPYEQYGDIGCRVVPGFNDRCPSMVSEPLAPRGTSIDVDGTIGLRTKEHINQNRILVSPDGSMLYSVGTREDDFSYSFTTITAWRLDPGNLGGDGAIAWKRDFGGTAEFPRTKPAAAQMSHDGSRLYVTGAVWVEDNLASAVREMWVGAFDTVDGKVVWVRKLRGAAEEREYVTTPAFAMSVSPDDSQVFASATGVNLPNTDPRQWSRQYALDASTGEVEWQTDYRDHVNYADVWSPQREEVSPDGSRLFSIVRLQNNELENTGYAAIAYDTATGEEIWSRKYLFPEEDGRQSVPYNLILSPDGRKVIVAVQHWLWPGARYRFAAYDAIDGDTLWVKEHSANTGTGCDQENWVSLSTNAPALAVNPSGDTVYLTGGADYRHPDATDGGCNSRTKNDPSRTMAATVLLAVDTDSGELRWEKHYGQDGGYSCNPCSITMIPGPNATDAGSRIVVTSRYFVWEIGRSYPWTFLVDAATGDQMWQARYLDTHNDGETLIREGAVQKRGVVTADGSRVYRINDEYSPTRGWTAGRYQVIGYDLDPVRAPTPDPDPTPTPTVTPTEEPTPTPAPSQSPAPDVTDVSFTERSRTSGQYSDETLLEARLTDSGGDPIQGKELTFDLVGAESSRSFTATTNGDGLAAVTPRLEEKPGPYQLTVRYDGDDDHAGDADTISFVVEKEDSALDLTETKGKDKALRAHLSDVDTPAHGIAGRTVDFYAGTELLGSATTDQDGVATFEPPEQKGKKPAYEARFDGDDFYLAASDDEDKGGNGGNGGGGNSGRDASTSDGGKVLLM